jgi:hypothetical protein
MLNFGPLELSKQSRLYYTETNEGTLHLFASVDPKYEVSPKYFKDEWTDRHAFQLVCKARMMVQHRKGTVLLYMDISDGSLELRRSLNVCTLCGRGSCPCARRTSATRGWKWVRSAAPFVIQAILLNWAHFQWIFCIRHHLHLLKWQKITRVR